jgi:ribosome-associated toxin RatA of RatAB toxin-antitoxin module
MFDMEYSQHHATRRLLCLVRGALSLWIGMGVMILFMTMQRVESFQPIVCTPTATHSRRSLLPLPTLQATLSPQFTQQGEYKNRHPHDGVAIPWPILAGGSNPLSSYVQLDDQAKKTLARGKPVRTMAQFQALNGGNNNNNNGHQQPRTNTISRRLIVQDVQAPAKTIVDRILDYNQYSKMVPGISQSEIYHRETTTMATTVVGSSEDKEEEGTSQQRLGVRMKAGVPFMQFEFYSDIRYDPSQHTISWTLDYSRHSQVYESVGMWYIQPLFQNEERNDDDDYAQQQQQLSSSWSRVYYAAEHTLFKSAPKQVQYLINKSSLKDGVS